MKIGVVGCGALGSFYGPSSRAAGEEVHFLLRSDYEVVRRAGVRIQSFQGDFARSPASVPRSPREIGVCDLVLIGLKQRRTTNFARLLAALGRPPDGAAHIAEWLG